MTIDPEERDDIFEDKEIPKNSVPKCRVFGSLKDSGHVDDDFFDPLPEEERNVWDGK